MSRGVSYPGEADPVLSEVLVSGVGSEFEEARERACEWIAGTEGAFWLQVVGDGSALVRDPEYAEPEFDAVEAALPHQVALVTGYGDELVHEAVGEIAKRMYVHYVAFTTDPASEGLGVETILEEATEADREAAHWFFDGIPDEDVQYPRASSLEVQRDRAVSLLGNERVTWFWLQVLREEAPLKQVVRHGPRDPMNPSSEWTESTCLDADVEYRFAQPESLDEETYLQLHSQIRAQRLFVAARTPDVSLGGLTRFTAEHALRTGWVYAYP